MNTASTTASTLFDINYDQLVFDNIEDTFDEWAEIRELKSRSKAIRQQRDEIRRLKTEVI